MADVNDYIEEEAFMLERSGEMPEVAYHSSVYYLTRDREGPEIELTEAHHAILKKSVIVQYVNIMRRDLTPGNRDKSLYRGLERCVDNWDRLVNFSQRQRLDVSHVRREMAAALMYFLANEVRECRNGNRTSCINCHEPKLAKFILELGLDADEIDRGWRELCLTTTPASGNTESRKFNFKKI